jgi:uncharacterized membrane protein YqaE (UPF0057 family)
MTVESILSALAISVTVPPVAVWLHRKCIHMDEIVKRAIGVLLILIPPFGALLALGEISHVLNVIFLTLTSTISAAAGTAYAYYKDYDFDSRP